MTGELAHGYEGRLMHFNQAKNRTTFLAAIARQFRLPSDTPRILLLAAAAGSDSASFCRNHTLMPFLRATVARSMALSIHGSTTDKCLLRKSALRLGNQLPRLCRACIAEDTSSFNFSVWHREHQLPGVDWCPTHRTPLAEVSESEGYECVPADHLDKAVDLAVGDLSDWPVLERYCELARSSLQFSRPLAETAAGKLLGNQARQQGVRFSDRGTRTLLSDMAQDSLPKSWLESQLPGLCDKPRGKYYGPLDTTCRSRGTTSSASIILAFALLYPSVGKAEQVLKLALKGAPPVAEAKSKRRKGTKSGVRGFWQSAVIRQYYVQCEGLHWKIAEGLGFHRTYVRTRLCAEGLPNLGDSINRQALEAALAFISGEPLDSAILKHGGDQAAFEYWLRQNTRTIARALKLKC